MGLIAKKKILLIVFISKSMSVQSDSVMVSLSSLMMAGTYLVPNDFPGLIPVEYWHPGRTYHILGIKG